MYPVGKIYPSRNDKDFRSREVYGDHHNKSGISSPLLHLPIDMIKDIPIGDSLRLLHLGVMKKLLAAWRDGYCRNSGEKLKLKAKQISGLSEFLTSNCRLPREIHRQMRGLHVLSHWKGVECRSFLLYVGIVCLKGVLPENVYDHFLLLVCATHICECASLAYLLPAARVFLNDFVTTFAKIYGRQYVSSNIHNLVHLVDDVEHLGPLQSFAAYPFENLLGDIKRLVQAKKFTLRQVVNRLVEIANVNGRPIEVPDLIARNATITLPDDPLKIVLSNSNFGGNISIELRSRLTKANNETDNSSALACYSKADFGTFSLSTDEANRWFYTSDKKIVCLINIISCNDKVSLYGIEVLDKENFFEYPVPSNIFDIYAAAHFNVDADNTKNHRAGLIARLYNSFTRVFVPLLHSRS